MKLWKLHDITGSLDPGIADVVRLLRNELVDTIASCQGGEGHGFEYPTVIISPNDPTDMHSARMKVAWILQQAGIGGYSISECYAYQNAAVSDARMDANYLKVEFWRTNGDPVIPARPNKQEKGTQ